MASMFNQRIISRSIWTAATPQTSPRIPVQNDNLSWSEDGQLVGVGHTGFPVIGTQPCPTPERCKTHCGFPFAAYIAIDPKTLDVSDIVHPQKRRYSRRRRLPS